MMKFFYPSRQSCTFEILCIKYLTVKRHGQMHAAKKRINRHINNVFIFKIFVHSNCLIFRNVFSHCQVLLLFFTSFHSFSVNNLFFYYGLKSWISPKSQLHCGMKLDPNCILQCSKFLLGFSCNAKQRINPNVSHAHNQSCVNSKT